MARNQLVARALCHCYGADALPVRLPQVGVKTKAAPRGTYVRDAVSVALMRDT